MKEQVIIQAITISRKKEQYFFQVKLPRDTHKIIGVETGLYMQNVPSEYFVATQDETSIIRRNTLMGILQLRTNGKPDIFYSKEIFERDINTGAGEVKIFPIDTISPRKITVPLDGNSFYDFQLWTHGTKREEDPLNIRGCNIINGQFKDAIGEIFGMDVQYTLMLYIWIEKKMNKDDN